MSVRRRYINENTSAKFMEAIAMSPTVSAESVDELLDTFFLSIFVGPFCLYCIG